MQNRPEARFMQPIHSYVSASSKSARGSSVQLDGSHVSMPRRPASPKVELTRLLHSTFQYRKPHQYALNDERLASILRATWHDTAWG